MINRRRIVLNRRRIVLATIASLAASAVFGLAPDVPYAADVQRVEIHTPASIAGTYAAGSTSFGPGGGYSVTGQVVLAQDWALAPSSQFDACTPLTNAGEVTGKIALIDRGTCTFVTKVNNAQVAGAIGVIITNTPTSSNPDEAPNLIGADPTTDPTITIPAVGVSLNTGNLIKSNIGVGVVTATLTGALDNEAPVLALPDNLSVGTNSGCSYAGPIGTATASDDTTPPALIQITNDAPASFPLGSTTVTWLATDANGSERSGTQLVVVGDDDRPSLTAPENRTVGTNSGAAYDGGIGAASASDNCSSGGALSITNDAPVTFPLGQTTVTWLVTDATGNSASAIQLVTVVDDDAPTLTAPASITVLSDPGTVSAVILDAALGTATASDNAGPVTMTRSGVPTGNLFPLGETTITYTATDAFGNQATATQTVTVRARDSEAPNLVAPPSLVVNATSPAGAVVTYAASATDDADPNPVVSCTPASGSTFAIGVTTVRCTATDNAGNSSQANFTVTVKGPVQQIVDLIDKTLAFMDQPQLEATLKAQLQAVVVALVANRPTVVCGLLNTYIAAVKAAPARAGLTPAETAELVADANRIRTVVGCR